MCGRYTLICIDDLGRRFRIYDPSLGNRSKFNVTPGDFMPVIVNHGRTEATGMKWGLPIDPERSLPVINARAETLIEKPAFCDLLKNQRCLIPATGFYEWKNEGSRRIPFYFRMKKKSLFAFAGLYDSWRDASGTLNHAYTIITTSSSDPVKPVHERMPVILRPEDEERWIAGPRPTSRELHEILAPVLPDEMEVYPVSSLVNKTGIDDKRLIEPVPQLG